MKIALVALVLGCVAFNAYVLWDTLIRDAGKPILIRDQPEETRDVDA